MHTHPSRARHNKRSPRIVLSLGTSALWLSVAIQNLSPSGAFALVENPASSLCRRRCGFVRIDSIGTKATPRNGICLFSSDQDKEDGLSSSFPVDTKGTSSRSFFRKRVRRLTKKIVAWSANENGDDTDGKLERIPDGTNKDIVDEAFAPLEESLQDLEDSLLNARAALEEAKLRSYKTLDALEGAVAKDITATNTDGEPQSGANGSDTDIYTDLESLTFEDINYESSEMAPPFLDEFSCLMTDAEPLVRVEKAPDNSRRIFAGIDILASTEDVWNVLTNYHELQNVIPNLVVNDVLDLYDADTSAEEEASAPRNEDLSEEVRCQNLAKTMKGSLLRQVGGAKVAGINFSAKTTLEVREWPTGMPDFAHFMDEMWEGKSREERAKEYPRIKLKRYRFPRPFAVSNLPTKDISMQSIENDDGEFRLYQGVWRMQPLVGCAPPGINAMRLTYAVEISPRVYLPVRLVEGRIVTDLCANLEAIRKAVSAPQADAQQQPQSVEEKVAVP